MESLYNRRVSNIRVIEVGANLGDCSLWAAAMYDIYVVAFEPLPESAEVFRQSVQASKMSNLFTIHEAAVGGERTPFAGVFLQEW